MSFDVLQQMKKHFPKLRRLLAVSTLVGSFVIFVAFIFFAAGKITLTSFFGVALLGFFVMLPAGLVTQAQDREIAKVSVNWPERIAFILFLFWLIDVPEFHALLDRVSKSNGLLDWRLILAAAIWTVYSIYKIWRALARLSDGAIYRFMSAKKIQEAEQDAPSNR